MLRQLFDYHHLARVGNFELYFPKQKQGTSSTIKYLDTKNVDSSGKKTLKAINTRKVNSGGTIFVVDLRMTITVGISIAK